VADRRVAYGILAVGGAVLMAGSLFLDWFQVNTGDSEFDVTGWNAFEMADIGLVAAALVALYCVVLGARRPTPAVARALMLAGGSAAAIVVIQMIDKPPLLGFGLNVSLRAGAWIGLAGAILVFAAGALQLGARPALRESRGL
jgi:hypothetical protein